jgi:transposase
MGVSKSDVDKWVRLLKTERSASNYNASQFTADKSKIRELEKKIKLLVHEN